MLFTMLGRGVRRAADCLRQRRQPAAGAHGGAQQGGGDSDRARRQPRPAPSRSCSPRRSCSRSPAPPSACVDRQGRHRLLQRRVGHCRTRRCGWKPRWTRRCIAFVVGLTGLATLMAGTIPALRATKTDVAAVMNDEARGSSSGRMGRITRGLVDRPAGRVVRPAGGCRADDPHRDQRVALRLRLRHQRHLHGAARPVREGLPHARRRSGSSTTRCCSGLEGRPGVRAVAFTSDLPARGGQMQPVTLDGVAYPTEQDHPLARRIVITPRYFDIVDVKPVRGRTFERTDGADAQPVAIVNERFVELFFKDRDPLGARIKLGPDDVPWRTIVGVVPDLYLGGAIGALNAASRRRLHPADAERHQLHEPGGQDRAGGDELHGDDPGRGAPPRSGAAALLGALAGRAVRARHVRSTALFGTLFVAFGLAALAMATIGLYGVMSFSTGTRTREIGVRMALGAERRTVLMMILAAGRLADRRRDWPSASVLAALLSRGLGHAAVRRAAVGSGGVRHGRAGAGGGRHAGVVHPGAAGDAHRRRSTPCASTDRHGRGAGPAHVVRLCRAAVESTFSRARR